VRLLLAEDDPLLGDGLKTALQKEGYTVEWLKHGEQALAAALREDFSAVILDLGLPGLDGLEVLKQLRRRQSPVPVLILTARDAVDDRVSGLDLGGDDYLTKPFDLDELSARLRAIVRRSQGRSAPLLVHAGIELDPAANTVTQQGRPVELSLKEFTILRYLLEHKGRVVPRARLEETLYGWDKGIESNAVEVHIHNLRKKLGKSLIKTERGAGYRIQ
jgi:two-component system response regulator QseB